MILRAAEEDLAALVVLEQALFGVDAWSESSLAEELTAPGHLLVVANNDVGAVVGYACTLTVGEVADLLRIGVASDHRRQGIASGLLGHVEKSAVEGGVRRILLEVSADNVSAVAFYRAHQFVTIDRREAYYKDGVAALVMERALDGSVA